MKQEWMFITTKTEIKSILKYQIWETIFFILAMISVFSPFFRESIGGIIITIGLIFHVIATIRILIKSIKCFSVISGINNKLAKNTLFRYMIILMIWFVFICLFTVLSTYAIFNFTSILLNDLLGAIFANSLKIYLFGQFIMLSYTIFISRDLKKKINMKIWKNTKM